MGVLYKSIVDIVPVVEEVIGAGGDFTLTVTGSSMFPMLCSGRDSVTLTKVQKIKKYDVILYKRHNGGFVLHRVVKVSGNELYLCGDNQSVIEYPVLAENVIAAVKGFYRKGKYYKTTEFVYRLYCFFWVALIKFRMPILRIAKKILKIIRN